MPHQLLAYGLARSYQGLVLRYQALVSRYQALVVQRSQPQHQSETNHMNCSSFRLICHWH